MANRKVGEHLEGNTSPIYCVSQVLLLPNTMQSSEWGHAKTACQKHMGKECADSPFSVGMLRNVSLCLCDIIALVTALHQRSSPPSGTSIVNSQILDPVAVTTPSANGVSPNMDLNFTNACEWILYL